MLRNNWMINPIHHPPKMDVLPKTSSNHPCSRWQIRPPNSSDDHFLLSNINPSSTPNASLLQY